MHLLPICCFYATWCHLGFCFSIYSFWCSSNDRFSSSSFLLPKKKPYNSQFTLVTLRMVSASIFMVPIFLFYCLIDKNFRKEVLENTSAVNFIKMSIMGFFNNAVPFVFVGIAEVTINTGTFDKIDITLDAKNN